MVLLDFPEWLGAIIFGSNLYQQEGAWYLSSLVIAFFSKLTRQL